MSKPSIGSENKPIEHLWVKNLHTNKDFIPVGTILAFAGNGTIPNGYLLCDGAAYSRTAFPDLFAAIGTDYGAGDGSTTFNVPDSNQAKRFLQGDTVAGTVKNAGLPNIKGTTDWWSYGHGGSNPTGAFYNALPPQTNTFSVPGAGTGAGNQIVAFNASKDNPIYSDSVTTVQPDALTTRYIIKAFDGQTADSALIDITQFENELGNKADRSLSNLTDAGKSFSFPSGTYVDISSYVNSGTNYTAPADGFVQVRAISKAANAYADVGTVDGSTGVLSATSMRATSVNQPMNNWVAVKKGQNVGFSVSIPVATYINSISVFFIYAQGEVPN